MSTPSNAMPEPSLQTPGIVASTQVSEAGLFYWSVRRELWEYRSIYLAPLAIAGTILLAFLLVLVHLPETMRTLSSLDPAQQRQALAHPYNIAEGLVMGVAFLVSIFYSLDALYGERRDRSILFWKSLPVSDLTSVLAKASIPLVVLPVLAFAITVVTEFVMLVLSCIVLLANGLSVATLWTQLQLPQSLSMLLYHLVTAHMLWYAPLYAWLLLVSAWARRTPFLWAVLPAVAIGIFEKIAFHSSYFVNFLKYRIGGGSDDGGQMMGDLPYHPGMHVSLGAFLVSPGLWIGLMFAGAFLFAAARLRRNREAI